MLVVEPEEELRVEKKTWRSQAAALDILNTDPFMKSYLGWTYAMYLSTGSLCTPEYGGLGSSGLWNWWKGLILKSADEELINSSESCEKLAYMYPELHYFFALMGS